MDNISAELVIYFEDPFWVGVVQRTEAKRLSAAKVTFGAEPKDYEVYDFLLQNYYRLRFSPEVKTAVKNRCTNPKRMLKQAAKETKGAGIGTKSQQALQLQREMQKCEHKAASKEQKEERAKRIFELKKRKRKEKHKGR